MLLKCQECEYCNSARYFAGDINCKHPFLIRGEDGKPCWLLVDGKHPAWVMPEWCPNSAVDS
jgi:hypothetical protein